MSSLLLVLISVLCGILFILCLYMFYYIRFLLTQLSVLAANMPELKNILKGFSDHIERVNEMPMYFGDPTLQELVAHSKSIVEDVSAFADEFLVQPVDIGGQPIAPKKEKDEPTTKE